MPWPEPAFCRCDTGSRLPARPVGASRPISSKGENQIHALQHIQDQFVNLVFCTKPAISDSAKQDVFADRRQRVVGVGGKEVDTLPKHWIEILGKCFTQLQDFFLVTFLQDAQTMPSPYQPVRQGTQQSPVSSFQVGYRLFSFPAETIYASTCEDHQHRQNHSVRKTHGLLVDRKTAPPWW